MLLSRGRIPKVACVSLLLLLSLSGPSGASASPLSVRIITHTANHQADCSSFDACQTDNARVYFWYANHSSSADVECSNGHDANLEADDRDDVENALSGPNGFRSTELAFVYDSPPTFSGSGTETDIIYQECDALVAPGDDGGHDL